MRYYIVLLLVFSTFSTNLYSNDDHPFNVWMGVGIGPGTISDVSKSAAGILSANAIYKNFSVSVRYAFNSHERQFCGRLNSVSCKELNRGDITSREYIDDRSILVGFGEFSDRILFTINSGISMVYQRDRRYYGHPVSSRTVVGIPVESNFLVKVTDHAGFGTTLFYNFNSAEPFGGLLFTLNIGYLK